MNHITKNNQYNIGYICSTLQCEKGLSEKSAFNFITKDFQKKVFTFEDLHIYSNKTANILNLPGIKKGDVIFTYLPKVPEQFFIFTGILKYEAIAGTLFSNFGEEALFDRLSDSKASVVFTKKNLYRKIKKIEDKLPHLKYIILIDEESDLSSKILSYPRLMEKVSSSFEVNDTSPKTPSVLHYTSGSTGKPKGVLHVHGAAEMINKTSREILQLNEHETYWCTADQGWVTGTSYGITGPWSLGVSQIHFEGAFDRESYFRILSEEKVSVWYTAPTLLRMLMAGEDDFYRSFDLSSLKYIFSVGEPLNPEILAWGRRVLDKDIYDTWFQTETGAIMIANRPGLPIKPGSMGKPVNTITAKIINREDFSEEQVNAPGYLCLKPGWPSMFTAYLNNPEVYGNKFKDSCYFTGDEARVDEDGYFWFLGRSDDVINTAGHLISPFEIESALLELPEVVESAAVAVPDDILFEAIVVFVKTKVEVLEPEELKLKIRLYLSNKLSTVATPKEVVFTGNIPKNKSGKIMRRVLKAKYMGVDAGDVSTMEEF